MKENFIYNFFLKIILWGIITSEMVMSSQKKNYIVDIVNHPHVYLIDPSLTLLSLLIFKALIYTPVEIQLCCF